jgi:hypothetical protein
MNRRFGLLAGVSSLAVLALAGGLPAGEQSPEVRASIKRGLEWLKDTQSRDGHWEATGGQYPTSMTALGGMAMLMEGSTLREGKYSENISRAVTWLTAPNRCQSSGLIGDTTNGTERERYMYGHGFALLFLSCVYGEEEDADRRKRLEVILTKGVEFCGKAQTDRGGWGYVSAKEGGGFDEGSVTITQIQALRAAKNAGIVVPKTIIDKAVKYLKDCTTPRGGVIYSLAHGGPAAGAERPPLTAAAVACSFSAGDYKSDLAKQWIKFCQNAIPVARGRVGHDEYMHYYYSQAVYILGDDRYAEMFPDVKNKDDQLTWSKYKASMYDSVVKSQNGDGSWSGGYIGPIFTTCVNLTILQLENCTLPIYQR